MSSNGRGDARRRKVEPALLAGVGVLVGCTLLARRLGYQLGAATVVRCRQGHLFTTIWIPGVKFKALDLGVARVQRCPIGRDWSLVVPVRESELTETQRQRAHAHRDVRVP